MSSDVNVSSKPAWQVAFEEWWPTSEQAAYDAQHRGFAEVAFKAAWERRKTLANWATEIHEWSTGNGWWSKPTDNIAGKLLLVHSEISEAAEELRAAGPCPFGAPDVDFDDLRRVEYEHPDQPEIRLDFDFDADIKGRLLKPAGFRSELADTIIRILDIYARIAADPDEDIATKMAYNATRKFRHGGLSL